MTNSLPALKSLYTAGLANKEIVLYEGQLEIDLGNNKIQGTGRVRYVWFPNPQIQFDFLTQNSIFEILQNFNSLNSNQTSNLILVDISASPVKMFISSCTSDGNIGNSIYGRIDEAVIIKEEPEPDLSYILFHVVNFHNFTGAESVTLQTPSSISFRSRLTFKEAGWKLTLDEIKSTKGSVSSLKQIGGFAITHIGRLEKLDGSTFSSEDGIFFLKKFSKFLSFVRGFHISIILLSGYDANAKKIWEYWEASRSDSWKNVRSWSPQNQESELTQVFPGFLQWYDSWDDSEKKALDWYLEANYNPTVELDTIVVQVAFELLAWVFLVEKGAKKFSRSQFGKLTAKNQILELFKELNISSQIPSNSSFLNDLNQFAAQNSWIDSPSIITGMRNAITHAKPQKRNQLHSSSPMVKIGATHLGLWYLEIALLKIFNYQSFYFNRLEEVNQKLVP
ncbi:MAG: hypothetical protein AAFO95_19595 [Cyanobacteria bacterium J06600_6]